MRRRSRGALAAVTLSALAVGWLLAFTLGAPAGAHTPHDDQADVAVSPGFATDGRVWAVAQRLLLRSDDGGATWIQLHAGVPASVSLVEVAPGDPSVLYLAAAFGGFARTSDGGDSWEPASAPSLAVHAVAVSPVDPSTVLVATAEDGSHLSTDGGDTWQALPAERSGPVVAFGAEAALLLGDDQGRVHRSDDNGLTWTTAEVAPGTGITALAGGGDEVVYAGTGDGRVARSDDDGRTFAAPGDAPLADEPVASLARSPHHATDHTVWASLETAGAFRSSDRGATWTAADAGLTTDPQAQETGLPDFRTIVAATGDGPTATTLFLAGFDGLFRSTDGGEQWLGAETLAERIVAVAVSPTFAGDRTVAVATYLKGAFISHDAGETWLPMRDGLEYPLSPGNELVPLRRMHGMAFSPAYQRDRTVYSASWTGFLLHRVDRWTEVLIGQGPAGTAELLQQFVMGVHPNGTIYLGTQFGEVYRSTRGGQHGSWEVVGQVGGEVRSLLVDPTNGDLWVATNADVFVSRDGGATFEGTDLGRPSMVAGWFGSDDAVVFAGTPDGLFVTRDGGAAWEPAPVVDGVAADGSVEAIGVSPDLDEDGLVLVSLAQTGLHRSTDGGASFEPVAPELLADNQLIGELLSNATDAPIQFSPDFATDDTVFAHSDRAVLRSTDRGSTWDVLTIPSVFQVLADTAPEQLDLIVVPDPLPTPTPVEDHGTATAVAWVIVALAAAGLGVVVAVSRPRPRG